MIDPTSTPPPVPNRLSGAPDPVPDQLSGPTAPANDGGPTTDGPASPSDDPGSPAERSGLRVRRSTIVTAIIIAALLVGGFLFRDRLSGSAADIQVGDCFMLLPTEGDQSGQEVVQEVSHSPCPEPHDAEAFFVGDLEGGAGADFPATSVVEDFVSTVCLPAFGAYTGSDFLVQEVLDAGYFSPTADSWRLADREVMCYLTPISGSTTTQSYKGAKP
jgi:hypothetical protein